MAFVKGDPRINRDGRKKGDPSRVAKLRALLEPEAPELIQAAITAAKNGDSVMMRLCLERVCPPLKADSEPAQLDLDLSGSPVEQSRATLQAAADGRISIDDATALLSGIAATVKIIEAVELESRLTALEAQQGGKA